MLTAFDPNTAVTENEYFNIEYLKYTCLIQQFYSPYLTNTSFSLKHLVYFCKSLFSSYEKHTSKCMSVSQDPLTVH